VESVCWEAESFQSLFGSLGYALLNPLDCCHDPEHPAATDSSFVINFFRELVGKRLRDFNGGRYLFNETSVVAFSFLLSLLRNPMRLSIHYSCHCGCNTMSRMPSLIRKNGTRGVSKITSVSVVVVNSTSSA